MNPIGLYFILQMDTLLNNLANIHVICVVLVGIFGVTSIVCNIDIAIQDEKNIEIKNKSLKTLRNLRKLTVIFGVIVLFIYGVKMFIPSTKTLATTYLVSKLINNENMQILGSNSLEILKELSNSYLIELKNKDTNKNDFKKNKDTNL